MNGWTHWVPSVATATYTKGGIVFNPRDLVPLTSDEIAPLIVPSGGVTGGGTLDISYVNADYVIIDASSGTITNILSNTVGKTITIGVGAAGIVLQNNSNLSLPGGANFTFAAGQTITLYHGSPSTPI